MPRIHDIRSDIRDRLVQTGAFAGVYMSGLPEASGRPASDATAAAIEVAPGKAADRWDGYADATWGVAYDVEERIPVVVMARDNDPELRDARAEELVDVLKAAVNGRPLAGVVVADKTLVESWTPLPERHPERRYRCVVRVEYVVDEPDPADGNI